MAKPRSVKLRGLIMLRTLFKLSDAKHPVDLKIINECLRPYGLECERKAMNDTIDALEEFGIKISNKQKERTSGVWIDDHPLSDHDIGCIVFALTTNPHISKDQAEQVLEKLKHFVTVHQEPLLTNNVEFAHKKEPNDSMWRTFAVIQEAFS